MLQTLKHRPVSADREGVNALHAATTLSGLGARDGSQLQCRITPVSFQSAPGASGSLRAELRGPVVGLAGTLHRGLGGDREQG